MQNYSNPALVTEIYEQGRWVVADFQIDDLQRRIF